MNKGESFMFKSKKDDYLETRVGIKRDLKEGETSLLTLTNRSLHPENQRTAFYIKYDKEFYHVYDDLKNSTSFINQVNSSLVDLINKEMKKAKKPKYIIIYCPVIMDKETPHISVWNTEKKDFGLYDFELEEKLDNLFLKFAKEEKLIYV